MWGKYEIQATFDLGYMIMCIRFWGNEKSLDFYFWVIFFFFACSQYLTELLAEHQKLGPFNQVLPICSRLLNQGFPFFFLSLLTFWISLPCFVFPDRVWIALILFLLSFSFNHIDYSIHHTVITFVALHRFPLIAVVLPLTSILMFFNGGHCKFSCNWNPQVIPFLQCLNIWITTSSSLPLATCAFNDF